MNRTVKFRGVTSKNKWVYGCIIFIGNKEYIIDKNGIKHLFLKETTGQFTGFYDCNDREIYEGDILLPVLIDLYLGDKKCKYFDVYWYNKGFKVDLFDLFEIANKCKIVGNMYDDTEIKETLIYHEKE
jgi:hypothetical protein